MTAPPVAELRDDIDKFIPLNGFATVLAIIVIIVVLIWFISSRR